MASPKLIDVLSDVLPVGFRLKQRHVSSKPTPCEPIFSPPPGERPQPTYRESHFLSLSVFCDSTDESEVIAFAFEVLVYSTDCLTTLFVSKADSTGYLHLLGLPKGSPSLIKAVFTAFLSYLMKALQRPDIPVMLSLFARAQDQYLFPGSIENKSKHVLDDRGLIKWWCQVVDPILGDHTGANDTAMPPVESKKTAKAYLIVPGCDKYETRLFFPARARHNPEHGAKWQNSHPLYQVARFPAAPTRCLVPRFPDDPKERFLRDLDEELPDFQRPGTPSRSHKPGHWLSVKTLEGFWEMMAYRQECSAGRLVGFLWLVVADDEAGDIDALFTKKEGQGDPVPVNSVVGAAEINLPSITELPADSNDVLAARSDSPTPLPLAVDIPVPAPTPALPSLDTATVPDVAEVEKKINDLGGEPTPTAVSNSTYTAPNPVEVPILDQTKDYLWPISTRGDVVLSSDDYDSVMDFLDGTDFADLKISTESTGNWAKEVSKYSGCSDWGELIAGKKEPVSAPSDNGVGEAITNTLIPRKRKVDQGANSTDGNAEAKPVNLLQVRKKKKPVVEDVKATTQQE